MSQTLRTTRLSLAPWSDADVGLLGRLATTPDVVRHVGNGMLWSEVKVQAVHAANLQHWRRHGFGWRVARLPESTEPVGLIALNFAGEGSGVDPGEYEIGWWLAPSAWGRGLAREGAAALRDEAFGPLGAPSIIARIQPANSASLAVAGALGLVADGDGVGRTGEPFAVLRLRAEDWRAGSG